MLQGYLDQCPSIEAAWLIRDFHYLVIPRINQKWNINLLYNFESVWISNFLTSSLPHSLAFFLFVTGFLYVALAIQGRTL